MTGGAGVLPPPADGTAVAGRPPAPACELDPRHRAGCTVRPCTDARSWDDLAARVPWAAPQHAFAYGQALASCFGYLGADYRLFYRDGAPVAGLPLIHLSACPPFRAAYSSAFDAYGGPLIVPGHLDDQDLLQEISAVIDAAAAACRAFEMRFALPPTTPDVVLRCLQSRPSGATITRACPLLDLDLPLAEIQRRYEPSVRQAIRRSERQGVTVDRDAGIAEVRQAYPLYRATMRRLGATAKPWRFTAALLREKLAVAFVARLDGRPVGLVVLLVTQRMAKYWLSAADPAASTCRPTNALVHHAIAWCHERGIGLFNFGESYPERTGLVRFKEGWGTTRATSTVVVRIYRPRLRRLWVRALEPLARRTYAAWDRLRTALA